MHIDDEVTARTVKASEAFGRLHTNVWEQNGIRLDTKLKKVIEKQCTGTGAIKRQIPLLKPKREKNIQIDKIQ